MMEEQHQMQPAADEHAEAARGIEPTETAGLDHEEIEQQQAQDLPGREAMSLINANVAAPINAAIAANVLSDNSTAEAIAYQDAPITQTT
jgi:hypothetical protein